MPHTPLILPRSVPLHMSRWKSLIGCHVVVRAGENVTYAPTKGGIHHAHTGIVPGHHRHVTARHSHRLMLHCSPRYWMSGVCGIVPPCMHGHLPAICREGACLDVFAYTATNAYAFRHPDVFAYSATDAYGLGAIGVFCYSQTDAYALDGHPTFQPEEVAPLPTEGKQE